MTITEAIQEECRHDQGFGLVIQETKNGPLGGYLCRLCCTFQLNFNPRHFPFGVAYKEYVVKPGDLVAPKMRDSGP